MLKLLEIFKKSMHEIFYVTDSVTDMNSFSNIIDPPTKMANQNKIRSENGKWKSNRNFHNPFFQPNLSHWSFYSFPIYLGRNYYHDYWLITSICNFCISKWAKIRKKVQFRDLALITSQTRYQIPKSTFFEIFFERNGSGVKTKFKKKTVSLSG